MSYQRIIDYTIVSMAGIGFELQKIMGRRSLTGVARAGLYAGLIAVGPWMVSVGSLIALVLVLRPRIGAEAMDQFTSMITHCYALAMLNIGPFFIAADPLRSGSIL